MEIAEAVKVETRGEETVAGRKKSSSTSIKDVAVAEAVAVERT